MRKVTTKQQLAALSQEWKPFRCALAELHTMLKAALNRTRKAVEVQAKLHQTETSSDKKMPSKVASLVPQQSPSPTESFLDAVQCIASQIDTVNVTAEFVADPDFDIKLPTLFRILPEDAATDTDVKACVQTFAAKFLLSSSRSDAGRWNKPLDSDLQAKMNLLLEKVLGAQHKIVKREAIQAKSVQDLVNPSIFALKNGLEEINGEVAQLPTVRLGVQGTREVVCFDPMVVLPVVKAEKSQSSSLIKPVVIRKWLKTATRDDFAKLPESSAFVATVSVSDMLYVPARWIYWERVTGSVDFVGLKTSWLSPRYTDILDGFRQYLISVGKTSDLLQQVVDTLVMIE